MPNGGRPKAGIYAALSKGNEKSKIRFARRIHPANRIPLEIRCQDIKRPTGQGSPGLGGQEAGESKAGKEVSGKPEGEAPLY
jgi:hypothetical protein